MVALKHLGRTSWLRVLKMSKDILELSSTVFQDPARYVVWSRRLPRVNPGKRPLHTDGGEGHSLLIWRRCLLCWYFVQCFKVSEEFIKAV